MKKDNRGAEFEHSNRDFIGTRTTGARGFDGSENLLISDRGEEKLIGYTDLGLWGIEDVVEISTMLTLAQS